MKNKSLFVIPCYFDGSNRAIYDCVTSVIKFHPDDDIVIVDSDSSDKSYFNLSNNSKKISILDIQNKNYDSGAYWKAYKHFPNYDFYYLIHDSVILRTNLAMIDPSKFTSLRYFHSFRGVGGINYIRGRTDAVHFFIDRLLRREKQSFDAYGFDSHEQMDWVEEKLSSIRCYMPEIWVSIFGPIFFCPNNIMRLMLDGGLMNIFPNNKNEQMAMERLIGIFLQQNGINATNSLQGNHYVHPLDDQRIEKIIYKRA